MTVIKCSFAKVYYSIVISATVTQASKSMSASQSSLLESIGDDDLEPGNSLSQDGSTENLAVKPSVARRRSNVQEIENLYFTVSLFLMSAQMHRFYLCFGKRCG